jgi:RNA polymerase sigma-70 factor (ECF subfamily)
MAWARERMKSLSSPFENRWSFRPLSEDAVLPLWPGSWANLRSASLRVGGAVVSRGETTTAGLTSRTRHGERARDPSDADERARRSMDAYARGDDSAFGEVYDAIAGRLFAYLARQTRDEAMASDLLQQTLLQIHKNRGSYVAGAPVLPWAFAIGRRLFIDEFRRRKTDALANSRDVAEEDRTASETPDEEASTNEAARRVQAELARLPESQRVAFELLRVEGLSHDDAARVLGVTVSAVKLRAFRAYTALRAVLAETPSNAERRSSRPTRR